MRDPAARTAARLERGAALDGQRGPLAAYLRLLWNVSPALLRSPAAADDDGREPPFLSALGLHLPTAPATLTADAARRWYRASAAHAAAHLVYSPGAAHVAAKLVDPRPGWERSGLSPLTQALIGVLEDARVEALACRELPGLRRLWAPWHTILPTDGDGAEALMLRLARALIDPGCDDPHPFVRKGRALMFHDAAGQVLALRQPAELRDAASRLGNELGSRRLGFEARLCLPGPSYRDDNRWLWRADASTVDAVQPPPEGRWRDVIRHYPEWDAQSGRMRPAWCTARETAIPPSRRGPHPAAPAPDDALLLQRLVRVLQQSRLAHRSRRSRELEGDDFDLQAMLETQLACRIGAPAGERACRRALRALDEASVMLIIDSSAATALPFGDGATNRLAAAQRVAALLAEAMGRAGYRVALQGFSSNGRHDLRFQRVKSFDEPWNAVCAGRLAELRSAFCARLGTALRHARQALSVQPSARRLILVISNGAPHDIDVPDPLELVHDAREAVRAASRDGIATAGIGLDAGAGAAAVAHTIFGAPGCHRLRRIDALPMLMQRLLG